MGLRDINTNNSSLQIELIGNGRIKLRVINQNPDFLKQEIDKYFNWGGINGDGVQYDEKSYIFTTTKTRFLNCIKNILENRYRAKYSFEFSENEKNFFYFDNFLVDKANEIYNNVDKVKFSGQKYHSVYEYKILG